MFAPAEYPAKIPSRRASRQAFACIDREVEIEQTKGGTENVYDGDAPLENIREITLSQAGFQYSDELAPVLSDVSI